MACGETLGKTTASSNTISPKYKATATMAMMDGANRKNRTTKIRPIINANAMILVNGSLLVNILLFGERLCVFNVCHNSLHLFFRDAFITYDLVW